MDRQHWQKIKPILDEASRLEPGEREGYVQRACGDDDALREEVRSLLVFDHETYNILDRPVFDVNARDPAIGSRIDHYRIASPLGRGGMGEVYLATREDDYSQQVALKLIQRGLDSHDLVARFHQERQILAGLDHPSIARLFDGGTTDEGLPYLVMELVEGEPIDDYCDRHRLSIRRRLQLFRQVLAAVQFSHQHLVVHRDLKPGNILVTANGMPKLIDFGIAKLLLPSDGATPPAARQRPQLLSPRYASPEQLRNEKVTTASDVYALGVVLYQLLTGCHPYPVATVQEDELLRTICEVEPAPPSAASSRPQAAGLKAVTAEGLARARGTTPPKLRRQLADELDAIVMKAMRKLPEQRYGSVDKLSDDVGRYLSGMPVSARPSSFFYLVRKHARRHRLILVAAILALTAVGILAAAVVLRARLTDERARAETIGTFVEDLFRASNPDRADGEILSAREILDRARVRVGPRLAKHPAVRAAVTAVLGRVYQNLGDLAEAERLLDKALRLQRRHDADDDATMARRINELAAVLHDKGALKRAEHLYREALERIGGCNSPDSDALFIASNLAVLRTERGDYAEAEKIERCVQVRRRRLLPKGHPDIATSLGVEAIRRYHQGELDESERLLRQVLMIRRRYYGPVHTRVAKTLNNLGRVLYAAGREAEAEKTLRQALDIRKRLLSDDHLEVATSEKNLAQALTALGRAEQAEPLARHAAASLRSTLSADDWRVADAESILGGCLVALGRFGEGELLLTRSYPILEKEKGEASPYTHAARKRLAAYARLSPELVQGGTGRSPGETPGDPK